MWPWWRLGADPAPYIYPPEDFIPPVPPAPDEIVEAVTAEQIRTLITASNLRVDFGAELLDENDMVTEDISADLLSGEVEHQNYADVHGTCTLQLSRALTWATARVRPYQTLTGAGLTRSWSLGVFLLTTPETPLGETPITYSVSGYDKLHHLQKPVGDTYVMASGVGYLAAVRAAIIDSGYTGLAPLLDGTAEATTLAAPMVWVLDNSRWVDVINDLLAAVSYRGLYANRDGRFCSEPYQSPVVRAPVWTLDIADQGSVITLPNRTMKSDVFTPTNWWRFIQKGLAAQPVDGTGQYTVNLSGTEVAADQYRSTPQYLDVADQTALEARGDAAVQKATQVLKTVVVPLDALPIMGHFDVFLYRDAAGGLDHKCEARSWRMPLDGKDGQLTLEVL